MNLTTQQAEKKINQKYLGFCVHGSLTIVSQNEKTMVVRFLDDHGVVRTVTANKCGKTIRWSF